MTKRFHKAECRKCGAEFNSTGTTVNCIPCRKPKAAAAAIAPKATPVCFCGKTVLSAGVTCPRNCHERKSA